MAAFIEYRNIYKSFGTKEVLKGVDLTVNRGETMVILGGSGTGKSVMLKLTIGLLDQDRGQIVIDGQEVDDLTEPEWLPIRKRISYMFQWGALFDSMTVYGNVAFPLHERGDMPEEDIAIMVEEKLHLMGLSGTQPLYPADLSGGMRKRVALARSIIMDPECILYDEPTSGLDPITSDTINRLIRRMQKILGVTAIVVTHDINSMFHVGDRVAFLYKGKMEFVGTPEEARSTSHPILRGFIEGRNPNESDH